MTASSVIFLQNMPREIGVTTELGVSKWVLFYLAGKEKNKIKET